jgi:hypothetical protein
MRTLDARFDVRGQQSRVVEATQSPVDRRVRHIVKPRGPQPAQHVVPITVRLAQHGEHGHVEHALEQLALIHAPHTTT